jgi:glycosyltransferase involved in cell wall biosynthesis
MINFKQEDIVKSWINRYDAPLVSIQCLVYNHAPYIADCLDGILNQRTNFPFEVVVHEDASTDNSAEIIREYEKKFPLIIKPIYEKENQYSKHNIRNIINPLLRGKYVAVCEGDDYWCDSNKLQKQVEFLETHSDYSACTHNTFRTLLRGWFKRGKTLAMFEKKDKIFDISKISIMDCQYHTSSLVCKRDYFVNRPDFCFAQPGAGDLPLRIFLLMQGKIMRFGDVMSVYRSGVPGSWTRRIAMNRKKSIENTKNSIKMLQMANEWSDKKFNNKFEEYISYLHYKIILREKKFRLLTQDEYLKWWKKETFKNKFKLILKSMINRPL